MDNFFKREDIPVYSVGDWVIIRNVPAIYLGYGLMGRKGRIERIDRQFYTKEGKPPQVKYGIRMEGAENESQYGLFWLPPEMISLITDPLQIPYHRFYKDKRVPNPLPAVEAVYLNGSHTTIRWSDGTRTTVKCGEGEVYDMYAGFCAAVVKKFAGSTSNGKRILRETVVEQVPKLRPAKNTPPITEPNIVMEVVDDV